MNSSVTPLSCNTFAAKQVLLVLPILASSLIFIALPAWQLLAAGPFLWHVTQPSFVQGGIEAIVLVTLLASAQHATTPFLRLAILATVAELFLRRHGADLAIALDVLYFELCVALGALLIRLIRGTSPASVMAYLEAFFIGFCLLGVFAWTLSAAGHGSPNDLRWLILLLSVPVLFSRPHPWIVFAWQRIDILPKHTRILFAVLLGWFLIQIARSAVVIDFDGLWYGLRGEYVLAGQGSAFVSSGLVSPVYYYPKVYELFLLPVTGLGSITAITGVTIMMSVMLASALYVASGRLHIQNRSARLVCVLACMTLPAVANPMLSPKGDVFSALLLTLAWLKSLDLIGKRDSASLIWFIALLLLASQARLVAIPFAAALAAVTFLCLVFFRDVRKPSAAPDFTLAWFGLVLATAVTAFATTRTFMLAGMPTVAPEPLLKLWSWLGFQFKYPVGTLRYTFPRDWNDTLPLIVDFLFRPQQLAHIVITWTGNVWVWLLLVAALGAIQARKLNDFDARAAIPPMALVATSLILMFAWGHHDRGGDGNYFMAGMLAAIVLGFSAAWKTLQPPLARYALLACLGAFCLAQASYSFMSAAWTTGTRPFDFSLARGGHSLTEKKHAIVAAGGIAHIAHYLSKHQPAHVLGYVDYEPGFCLPAIFEHLVDISFSRPDLMKDRARFIGYVSETNTQYLILPNASHKAESIASKYVPPMISELARELSANPALAVVHDTDYDMYDMTALIHGASVGTEL